MIAKSACGVTFVVAIDELFPDAESVETVVTEAVLLMVVPPASDELLLTTSVNPPLPIATLALVQLIVPVPLTAGVVQFHPAGELRD